MRFKQLQTNGSSNFVYIIADEGCKEAVVIDPSNSVKDILDILQDWGVTLKYIIHTHGHGDHTGGTRALMSETGARLIAHPGSSMDPDIAVRNNEHRLLGNTEIIFIYTPGHTYDSLCVIADKYLFTGDTLFIDECGYAEQVGGDSYLMWESLFNRIMKLKDDLIVCPGHDMKKSTKTTDTLGNQKESNYSLKPRTKEEFKHFMLTP